MTTWLIDKSALVRLAESPDAAEWAARIERGLVRITTVTRLETGYSARSGPQMRAGFQRPPLSAIPVEYLTPAIEDRAVELLTLLADRGQHRAPSIPDLIIAATAELAGLTVLHLDKDFDLIAEITGQPMQRLTIDPVADMGDDTEQTEAGLSPGFPVWYLASGEAFDPGAGPQLRLGRLEDAIGVPILPWPRLTEELVVGVLVRDHHVLPFLKLFLGGAALLGQPGHPFRRLGQIGFSQVFADAVAVRHCGLGRAERLDGLIRAAAAELGVGGHGQAARAEGELVPRAPVFHRCLQRDLDPAAHLLEGAGGVGHRRVPPGGFRVGGRLSFRAGADGLLAGIFGDEADAAQLPAHVRGRPCRLDLGRVGVQQMTQETEFAIGS